MYLGSEHECLCNTKYIYLERRSAAAWRQEDYRGKVGHLRLQHESRNWTRCAACRTPDEIQFPALIMRCSGRVITAHHQIRKTSTCWHSIFWAACLTWRHYHLLALPITNGTPYVFFKYVDGWKHISLDEFPEKFKINLIVTGRKKDNPKISEADRKLGFVPAHIVAELNREPGRSREYYRRIAYQRGIQGAVSYHPHQIRQRIKGKLFNQWESSIALAEMPGKGIGCSGLSPRRGAAAVMPRIPLFPSSRQGAKVRAGGAAWGPGRAEESTAESAGLQRRKALSTSG